MPEPRNFLLNTDYPADKILETFTGSFTAAARYGLFDPRRSTETIVHSVGDWALINGAYSFDNSTWYPFGVRVADVSSGSPVFQTVEVSAYCDASTVVIKATNWTNSAETIYYALQLIARD